MPEAPAGVDPQPPILCDLDTGRSALEGEGEDRDAIGVEDRGGELHPQPGLAPGGQRHPSWRNAVQPSQYCTGSGPIRPDSIHPVSETGRMKPPKAWWMTSRPSSTASTPPSLSRKDRVTGTGSRERTAMHAGMAGGGAFPRGAVISDGSGCNAIRAGVPPHGPPKRSAWSRDRRGSAPDGSSGRKNLAGDPAADRRGRRQVTKEGGGSGEVHPPPTLRRPSQGSS